jgi:plasmid maintenance system antidote protein VapI
MTITNKTQIKRRLTHPGTMLREDFMPDYDLTFASLAEAIGVYRQSICGTLRRPSVTSSPGSDR